MTRRDGRCGRRIGQPKFMGLKGWDSLLKQEMGWKELRLLLSFYRFTNI